MFRVLPGQTRVWRVFRVLAGQGGLVVACFHYIGGVGSWWGLGDSGFVPGAGVCSDGGEGPGL